MSDDKRFSRKQPCAACPFSRTVAPGATGGSPPLMYIGQAHGPFFLPCHSEHDYTKEEERRDHRNPQCAGAAIFRENVGVSKLMPPGIHKLPGNTDKVFASAAEFLAHHYGVGVLITGLFLQRYPPGHWTRVELAKSGVQFMRSEEP